LKTHHIIFWFDNRQEEQKLAGYLQEHGYHCTSCRDRNHFDQLIDTQVTALDLGADDYILKPVKPQLFLKRAEAILSRKRTDAPHKNGNASGLTIDKERYVVMVDNSSYELPRKEFELINLFYSVPNKIFTREEIAIALWKEEKIAKQRTIDVHIRNIRRILGKNLIKTVKGFGYGLNKVAGIL
jgi:two-component system alkaline phosphatase synthesis response regulator PhoP